MASRRRLSGDDVIERACAFTNKHLLDSRKNDLDLISEIVSEAVEVDHLALSELWDYEDFKLLFDRIEEIMKQRRLWHE